MKLKHILAFDAADEYCKCDEEIPHPPCMAGAFSDGYEAGFNKARKMALKVLKDAEWHDVDELIPVVRNLGEEEEV